MVNYRRNLQAGGTYFFTVTLRDRRAKYLIDHVKALRQIVRDVQARSPFIINAMVILPDHWHAVWTLPPDDVAYAARIRLIKARFTKHLLKTGLQIEQDARGEYKLWQHRYWEHTIRDEYDLEAHINYIHINPVKHGYVTRPTDWPHSSIHRYIAKGLIPADWAVDIALGEFGEHVSS
jgi:putative transposase